VQGAHSPVCRLNKIKVRLRPNKRGSRTNNDDDDDNNNNNNNNNNSVKYINRAGLEKRDYGRRDPSH
jgi:hypothetical protein